MAQPEVGSEFAGHRLEGIAGRGGMGVVYRAVDIHLDRAVALKLIAEEYAEDDQFRERFKRESKVAASIKHPHVITIYRAGEEDGLLFITMDFIEGTDLRQLIASKGKLDPTAAAEIISQTASALDAAHKRGLVHRDVKPANILMPGDQKRHHAYLTDFGLTKATTAESGMTKTGMFVGTLDYVAPEQVQGAKLDARADVYSLGCVLYQALTGEVPYPRDSEPAKLWAHMGEDPPSVSEKAPDVPDAFDEVVKRAMAKDPEDRYLSAGDLGQAAVAAAEDKKLTRAERSVATGVAAPSEAAPVTKAPKKRGRKKKEPAATKTAAEAPAAEATKTAKGVPPKAPAKPPPKEPPTPGAPKPRDGKRRVPIPAIVGGGAALVIVALVAMFALGGGGGGEKSGDDASPSKSSGEASKSSDDGSSSSAGAVPTGTSAEDEAKIENVVETWSTKQDPAQCEISPAQNAIVTQGFLEKIFKADPPEAVSKCKEELPKFKRSGEVTVNSVNFVEDSAGVKTADVDVTFGDGEEGTYTLFPFPGAKFDWLLDDYELTKKGSNT